MKRRAGLASRAAMTVSMMLCTCVVKYSSAVSSHPGSQWECGMRCKVMRSEVVAEGVGWLREDMGIAQAAATSSENAQSSHLNRQSKQPSIQKVAMEGRCEFACVIKKGGQEKREHMGQRHQVASEEDEDEDVEARLFCVFCVCDGSLQLKQVPN